MKKIFTLVLMLAVVLTVSAQKKIAYVVASGTPSTLDSTDPFWQSLKANSAYSVTAVECAAGIGTSADITGADLVILTENPSSSAAGITELKGINKPILMMKLFALSCQSGRWGLAIDEATTSRANEPASELTLTVPAGKESHDIYKGVTISGGVVSVLVSSAGVKGMQTFPSAGILIADGTLNVLASTPTDASRFTIAEIPVGASLGGFSANYPSVKISKKMLMLGIHYPAQILGLTTDGLKLLNNSVSYLLAGSSSINDMGKFKNSIYGLESGIQVKVSESSTVSITSINGKVLTHKVVNGEMLIPCSKGVYIVKVINSSENKTQKIVVR